MPVKFISPTEILTLIQSGRPLDILDVRSPAEFDAVHARGARLTPLDTLDPSAIAAGRHDSTEPLYVICQSGARATQACQRLMDAGVERVFCVEGGTAA